MNAVVAGIILDGVQKLGVGRNKKTVNLCRRTAVFRQDIEPSPVLLRSIIKPSPDWFPDWSL